MKKMLVVLMVLLCVTVRANDVLEIKTTCYNMKTGQQEPGVVMFAFYPDHIRVTAQTNNVTTYNVIPCMAWSDLYDGLAPAKQWAKACFETRLHIVSRNLYTYSKASSVTGYRSGVTFLFYTIKGGRFAGVAVGIIDDDHPYNVLTAALSIDDVELLRARIKNHSK